MTYFRYCYLNPPMLNLSSFCTRTTLSAGLLLLCLFSVGAARANGNEEIPESYAGLSAYFRTYKDGSKTIREAVTSIRHLPPAEDSLNMLVQDIMPLMDRLKEDPYLPLVICRALTDTYYASYTNLDKSMVYTKMEMQYIEKLKVDRYYLYEAYSRICFLYLEKNQLDSAILYAKNTEEAIPTLTEAKQKAVLYRQLAIFYSQARMYDRSEAFARAGIASNEKHGIDFNNQSFYGTLALLKEVEMAPRDTIIAYLKKAVHYSLKEDITEQIAVYYRNMARQYSFSDRRDSAEKYFDLAAAYFEENPYRTGQFQLGLEYGQHLINFSEYVKAAKLVDSLGTTLDPGDFYSEGELYYLKIRLALREHNIPLVEAYIASRDSLVLLDFSKSAQEAKEEMATRFETEKKENENQRLQTENNQFRALWIIAIILVIALLCILTLFILNRKKERALAEKEADNLILLNREKELKLHATEAENSYLQRQLKENIERVLQQQATNQHLLSKVEELKDEQSNPVLKRKTQQIQQLVKSRYSEDLLHEIEEKAKIAFPELLHFLQDNLADRNRLETLYCLMVVMEYSNEEIMTLSQRSEKALKSMRYRIRKRLDLDDAISLAEFLKQKAGKTVSPRIPVSDYSTL